VLELPGHDLLHAEDDLRSKFHVESRRLLESRRFLLGLGGLRSEFLHRDFCLCHFYIHLPLSMSTFITHHRYMKVWWRRPPLGKCAATRGLSARILASGGSPPTLSRTPRVSRSPRR